MQEQFSSILHVLTKFVGTVFQQFVAILDNLKGFVSAGYNNVPIVLARTAKGNS